MESPLVNSFPYDVELALASLTSCELVSLDPKPTREQPDAPANKLRGFTVIGSVNLTPEQAHTALEDLRASMAAWTGALSLCMFQPRHALCIKSPSLNVDILICYECGDVLAYAESGISPVQIDARRSACLDGLLKAGGVPLATVPSNGQGDERPA